MKRQGRNLLFGGPLEGADIKQYQSELQQLGSDTPANEMKNASYCESTREAMKKFQKPNGLDTNGVPGELGARLINASVDALHPISEPNPKLASFIIRRHIHQLDGRPLAGSTLTYVDQGLHSQEFLGKMTTNQDFMKPCLQRSGLGTLVMHLDTPTI